MTPSTLVIAASILLPAAGLVAWGWFTWAQVRQELHSFSGFEGMHFDI